MESAFGVEHGEISKVSEKTKENLKTYGYGGTGRAIVEAPKGKRLQAYKDGQKVRLKGMGVGAAAGGATGAAAGALSRGKFKPKTGALAGGYGGSLAGALATEKKSYRAAKEKGGW